MKSLVVSLFLLSLTIPFATVFSQSNTNLGYCGYYLKYGYFGQIEVTPDNLNRMCIAWDDDEDTYPLDDAIRDEVNEIEYLNTLIAIARSNNQTDWAQYYEGTRDALEREVAAIVQTKTLERDSTVRAKQRQIELRAAEEKDEQITLGVFIIFGIFSAWIGFFLLKNHFQALKPFLIIGGVIGVFVYLSGLSEPATRTNPVNSSPSKSYFHGYECIDEDCEGHQAGYDSAKDREIQHASDCSGNSNSFVEGCQAWVENSPDPIWDVRE